MKVDKLFAVLVLGGGMLAGCGGQPQPKADAPEATDDAPADDGDDGDEMGEGGEGEAAAGEDGEDGKCAWF